MIIGSYHFSCVVAPLLYYIKLPVTIKLLDSIVWRFNSCVTFEELLSVEKEFLKSELSNSVDSSFFLTQYVLKNYEREKNLAVCLMLVRKGRFFLDLLCFLTMKDDPESSKELLDCYYEYYVEVTEEVNQRQKKKIIQIRIVAIKQIKIKKTA